MWQQWSTSELLVHSLGTSLCDRHFQLEICNGKRSGWQVIAEILYFFFFLTVTLEDNQGNACYANMLLWQVLRRSLRIQVKLFDLQWVLNE